MGHNCKRELADVDGIVVVVGETVVVGRTVEVVEQLLPAVASITAAVAAVAVALLETCWTFCSSWRRRCPRPAFPSPCPRGFAALRAIPPLRASSSSDDGKPSKEYCKR